MDISESNTNTTTDEQTFVELHQYLRQLISPEQEIIRGEPDFARVEAYWHIGRIIVETEQQGQDRADYGIHLVESLSVELTQHYGKGYKTSNLWWFKQFYLAFPILHAMRGELKNIRKGLRTELTWTHYRSLITIENQQERHFYLHSAADEKWSYRTLNRLIKSRYYYQVALGEDQLLNISIQKTVTQTESHRSRVAQIRRSLLAKIGWALVERDASGLTMVPLKPDILFYQYHLQRLVAIWVSENSPPLVEQIRQQLTQWNKTQSTKNSLHPIALIIDIKNALSLITTAANPPLSNWELSELPKSL